jgi:hypothetical protein
MQNTNLKMMEAKSCDGFKHLHFPAGAFLFRFPLLKSHKEVNPNDT